MDAKETLRKSLKADRIALGAEERENRTERITTNCLSVLKRLSNVKHIHVFLSIKRLHEINTVPLLQRLFQLDYQVYSSVTIRSLQKLATVKLSVDTLFKDDQMGIPVPEQPEFVEEDELIELVFVPLLGVDTFGNRLGYGMGFYDGFFKELREDVLKIGLSYDAPMATEIPHEPHDVPLDGCIYPEGIVLFDKSKFKF
jgi:5-formyltetrahydrofolate cyclo-ligase